MIVTMTGAAGRLGSQLCQWLLEQGHQVRALDRKYRKDLPVRLTMVDLLDPMAIYPHLEGADALVHLAYAWPAANAVPNWRVLADSTALNAHVFEAAREVGVPRVVFASTIQVVCGTHTENVRPPSRQLSYLPMDGQAPARPGNAYALSKAMAEMMLEHLCARRGVSGVALRLPWLCDPAALERERRRIRESQNKTLPEPTISQLNEMGAFLSFGDASRLIEAILRTPLEGYRVYMPTATAWHPLPIGQMIQQYYRDVALRRPLEQITSLIDISRITAETRWQPQDQIVE